MNKINNKETLNRFRRVYKEKIIDTGKAEKFEKYIDKQVTIEKNLVKIIGAVATIFLLFCPSDGPFGELCTIIATPLFVKLVESCGVLKKKLVLSAKRNFEEKVIHEDGSNKDIDIPNLEFSDALNTVKDLEDTTKKLIKIGRKPNWS